MGIDRLGKIIPVGSDAMRCRVVLGAGDSQSAESSDIVLAKVVVVASMNTALHGARTSSL
jgi:hypothetical protein